MIKTFFVCNAILCLEFSFSYNFLIIGGSSATAQGQPPALLAGMPVGPGVSPQPGFFSRGVWLPVVITFSSGQAKST